LKVRIQESQELYHELLEAPFDFDKNDTIDVDYESLAYANNKKELRNRWLERLKFSTLNTYYDKIEEQELALKNENHRNFYC